MEWDLAYIGNNGQFLMPLKQTKWNGAGKLYKAVRTRHTCALTASINDILASTRRGIHGRAMKSQLDKQTDFHVSQHITRKRLSAFIVTTDHACASSSA